MDEAKGIIITTPQDLIARCRGLYDKTDPESTGDLMRYPHEAITAIQAIHFLEGAGIVQEGTADGAVSKHMVPLDVLASKSNRSLDEVKLLIEDARKKGATHGEGDTAKRRDVRPFAIAPTATQSPHSSRSRNRTP